MTKVSLQYRTLGGLVLGGLVGGGLNALLGADNTALKWAATQIADPVGQLFLRLMLLMVIPLVASSLILAVAGIGDLRRIGSMGARSFGLALALSACSVAMGLLLANTIKPGKRLDPALATRLQEAHAQEAQKKVASATAAAPLDPAKAPLMSLVQGFVPTNIFSALSKDPPDMLGLMLFSLFLGAMLTLIPKATAGPVIAVAEGLYGAVSQAIGVILKLAPYAVFCLLFAMTARFGFALLPSLGWFVAAVLLGLAFQLGVVYSLVLALVARVSPAWFFRRIPHVIVTALSTSSSNATLPTALKVSEENLGIPKSVGSFVLTIGATANQNGTALFEGVTVLFLAQLAGVELTLGQQLLVVYLAILGGIGTAGVPSGSIPFIIAVLASVGVNPALIGIVLGVDRLLDMCRTVINVSGDLVIASCVARGQGWSPDAAAAQPAGGRS